MTLSEKVLANGAQMLHLQPIVVTQWPKLAWVASVRDGSNRVEVLHGPMVETADDWAVEAVWAGEFKNGDFDRTDLVFGTGVRVRGDQVVFVTSGTTFDRLWHVCLDQRRCIANSLPALLAVTGLTLRDDYPDYSRDLLTIRNGLDRCVKAIPTTTHPIESTCFHNLVLEQHALREVEKPDLTPSFRRFAEYYDYLFDVAKALAANMECLSRRYQVVPLTTISSGYDSAMAAAIAKQAGCSRAATIVNSSSLWRGSDSGKPVAEALGLACHEYPRTAKHYPDEVAIWCATGRSSEMSYTLFQYPEPLATVFTGYHGDRVWESHQPEYSDPFVAAGYSGRGLCEFRLHRGFFHCCVPFWGFRHASRLQSIMVHPEMSPWTLGNGYDRPIPRRILEEQGVSRRAFGMRKRMASHESRLHWPYSTDAQESFRRYLRARGLLALTELTASLLRRAAHADTLVRRNVPNWVRRRLWRARDWDGVAHSSLLFQWANHELKQQYLEGRQTSQPEPTKEISKSHTS